MNVSKSQQPPLSVVIASYNSAPWLPSTLTALSRALHAGGWVAEIVVVDDGSTDGTVESLRAIAARSPHPITVITQPNRGRFFSRWAGAEQAQHEHLLILDSRVLVHEKSMAYLASQLVSGLDIPWNGHVVSDPSAPLVGQFWSVPTALFWSEYLAHPRPSLITVDNFDRVPKGTGFLFIRRSIFQEASRHAWPEENAHLTSDDTKLLRFVVQRQPIRLDPGFAATYRPRTTIAQFLSHSWGRGTLFVDSYAGTSLARNVILILLAVVPVAASLALLVFLFSSMWIAALGIVTASLAALAVPLVLAATKRCPYRALLSYLVFVIPFGVVFVAGIARGILVHRKSFCAPTQSRPRRVRF